MKGWELGFWIVAIVIAVLVVVACDQPYPTQPGRVCLPGQEVMIAECAVPATHQAPCSVYAASGSTVNVTSVAGLCPGGPGAPLISTNQTTNQTNDQNTQVSNVVDFRWDARQDQWVRQTSGTPSTVRPNEADAEEGTINCGYNGDYLSCNRDPASDNDWHVRADGVSCDVPSTGGGDCDFNGDGSAGGSATPTRLLVEIPDSERVAVRVSTGDYEQWEDGR